MDGVFTGLRLTPQHRQCCMGPRRTARVFSRCFYVRVVNVEWASGDRCRRIFRYRNRDAEGLRHRTTSLAEKCRNGLLQLLILAESPFQERLLRTVGSSDMDLKSVVGKQ